MAHRVVVGTFPGAETTEHWPLIESLLEKAAIRNDAVTWSPGDIVWVAIDDGCIIAGATTRMIGPDTAELANIGGSRVFEWFREWEAMIADWARAAGARRIVSQGRKAWVRLVEPLGWVSSWPSRHGAHLTDFEKVLADDE